MNKKRSEKKRAKTAGVACVLVLLGKACPQAACPTNQHLIMQKSSHNTLMLTQLHQANTCSWVLPWATGGWPQEACELLPSGAASWHGRLTLGAAAVPLERLTAA